MAAVTLTSYRRVLDGIWRPELGPLRFLDIHYSALVEIADRASWRKKTYNNAVRVLRRVFKFGYRDYPDQHDPTGEMKGAHIQSKDRPAIDPFAIHQPRVRIEHRRSGAAQTRVTRAKVLRLVHRDGTAISDTGADAVGALD